MVPQDLIKPVALFTVLSLLTFPIMGCAKSGQQPMYRVVETTAYCGCSKCCSWERGSWKYLKLNFWNRYVSAGPDKGRKYTGDTASGTKPHEPQPGLMSTDSLYHPWMIPFRLMPWAMMAKEGTIAADTKYYPFGTRMYVPGYGWGVVEDRGGAIKGPDKIDLFFNSHQDALKWGRKNVNVYIEFQ